jgi:hypothetical protein
MKFSTFLSFRNFRNFPFQSLVIPRIESLSLAGEFARETILCFQIHSKNTKSRRYQTELMPPTPAKSASHFDTVNGHQECSFCKKNIGKVKNITRMKTHLIECPKAPADVKQIAHSETRKHHEDSVFSPPDPPPDLWTADKQATAILLLTIWLTKDGMPISTVESAALAAFLHLLNPNFKLCDRSTIPLG